MKPNFIQPDWPVPKQVKAFVTNRRGGVSQSPYASFNLAEHVEDDPEAVKTNRAILQQSLQLPAEPVWLEQVHSSRVIDAGQSQLSLKADASFTSQQEVICVVMTADCLPVLICNRRGTKVAAAHAGWRGLEAGVIEKTIEAMQEDADDLLVWLGPAIGPDAFEVGDEVKRAFEQHDADASKAFKPSNSGRWLADIYELAKQRLEKININHVYGAGFCTFTDKKQFYSYRRDGKTGRMASLIWIAGD